MSIFVTFDGTVYAVPQNNETGWGTTVTNLLVDIGNNATTLNGAQTLTNKTIQLASGTVAAPSAAFVSDTTTGLFLSAVGVLGLASGGNKTLTIDSTGDLIMGGGTNNLTFSPASTGNAPSINATGSDNNVGIAINPKGSGTVQVNGFLSKSVAKTLTATGTTQGTALALTAMVNIVTTAAASSGVILPAISNCTAIFVANEAANPFFVYPPSGSQINGLGANNPFTLSPSQMLMFLITSATQIYTPCATYG
jgi:hypothetical protein